MDSFVTEISIILFLTVLNGIFSMSELAMMSSNRGRLTTRADSGDRGAIAAVYLVENAAQFLATVQIGITLIGILAGVVGGATLAEDFSASLLGLGLSERFASSVAFTIVVGGITYLSLILGELVPKQIALSHPETIACLVSRPLMILSRICGPVVWILEKSSELAFKIFPFQIGQRSEISVDDIQSLISQGEREGEIQQSEKDMAFRVFKLDDRPISAFMTARREVVWLDVLLPFSDMWNLALSVPHSFFPVGEGDIDKVLGVVSIKDLCLVKASEGKKTIRDILRPALKVVASQNALGVLENFKKERRQVALVVDEHGGLSGMVTTHDLLEAIVGDLADYEGEAQAIVTREDGSVLVDATVDIQELLLHFKVEQRDGDLDDEFHSVGGVLFKQLGKVPSVGEKLRWAGLEFEVVDMDGHRIDKVLVIKANLETSDVASQSSGVIRA